MGGIGRIDAQDARRHSWWGKIAASLPKRSRAWHDGGRRGSGRTVNFTQLQRHTAGEGDPATPRCPAPRETPGGYSAGKTIRIAGAVYRARSFSGGQEGNEQWGGLRPSLIPDRRNGRLQ